MRPLRAAHTTWSIGWGWRHLPMNHSRHTPTVRVVNTSPFTMEPTVEAYIHKHMPAGAKTSSRAGGGGGSTYEHA